ncbi:hypothetical protein CEXT_144671 [Caerostris extrusa]|uniref:Uncharacterized protein n=1 Tax=Caerostris extrusa TaxID=172846 RepID=A0AAV4Y742_CAEEX|nr:hypothetical protein CEXT_144671 [Caerostris extrusa]
MASGQVQSVDQLRKENRLRGKDSRLPINPARVSLLFLHCLYDDGRSNGNLHAVVVFLQKHSGVNCTT